MICLNLRFQKVTNEVIQNCLDGPLKNLATIFVSSDPGSWLESCDKVIEMKVGIFGGNDGVNVGRIPICGPRWAVT